MIPLPDPHNTDRAADTPATHSLDDAPVPPPMALDVLASVIERSFDAPGDCVQWNLACPRTHRADGQQLRVDAQHELAAPAGQFHESSAPQAERCSERPWLVLVESASDVRQGKHADRLRTALERDAQLLVVVCNVDPMSNAIESALDLDPASHIAKRLHCEFVGPLTTGSTGELTESLDRFKQAGRSAVVYLDARQASAPPPHFEPVERPAGLDERTPGPGARLRQIAAGTLLRLSESDRRVSAYSTDVDPQLPTTWETRAREELAADARVPFALNHCAGLAARGGKPFLFLSVDEAQNYLGSVRREICLDRRGVTLVVEARRVDAAADGISSASLAGLRQLPDVSLLSPKDGTELCQMLCWCANQPDPAVIWLPEQSEPPVSWPQGEEIELGRAERLGLGLDVAIVAWGPQAAAAAIAAENLAQRGIGATVVNARFAQPLDVDSLADACRDVAYVVIVDDASAGGGFAGWVSEFLLRQAVAPNLTIVSPAARQVPFTSDNVHDQDAAAIVARCQWLSDPAVQVIQEEPLTPLRTCGARPITAAVTGGWQEHVGSHADRTARDRSQVLAKQLSPDVRAWVATYEEVGPRDVYLWKWCAHGVELTTLPCVSPELRAHVCDTKVLSIILCVLLDDVADEHGNGQLLDALLEMTCREPSSSLRGLDAVETRHAEVTRALWAEYWARVADYPCRAEYEPVLRYDLLQFQNTMRYSHLVNERPYLLNVAEHDLYTSHNMMMISFATLDLMCSPRFSRQEVGALREVIWHAQCMGRNGNLLSTWRRELANRDFTSGVFARAIMEGDLTHDDLAHGDLARLEATIRDRGHEAYFFKRWLEHRQRCHACARRVTSIDLRGVLEGHDRFLAMHLASEGLI